MIEPLFSPAQAWPGASSIGFGWLGGNRPLATAGVSPPQMLAVPTAVTQDAYELGRLGIARQYPVGLPLEMADYGVSALLAAVAVRRGQPLGPTNDPELEDFLYDALELLPGTGEVEVRVEGGRVTLTGLVQHKRLKHDLGEVVWGIPSVNDVQNNLTIATRRRPRVREGEQQQAAPGRKQG